MTAFSKKSKHVNASSSKGEIDKKQFHKSWCSLTELLEMLSLMCGRRKITPWIKLETFERAIIKSDSNKPLKHNFLLESSIVVAMNPWSLISVHRRGDRGTNTHVSNSLHLFQSSNARRRLSLQSYKRLCRKAESHSHPLGAPHSRNQPCQTSF